MWHILNWHEIYEKVKTSETYGLNYDIILSGYETFKTCELCT